MKNRKCDEIAKREIIIMLQKNEATDIVRILSADNMYVIILKYFNTKEIFHFHPVKIHV